MKNLTIRILTKVAAYATTLGVEVGVLTLLGKLWNKFEIAEEWATAHPVLAFVRLFLRSIITLAIYFGVLYVLITTFVTGIERWLDHTFPREEKTENE